MNIICRRMSSFHWANLADIKSWSKHVCDCESHWRFIPPRFVLIVFDMFDVMLCLHVVVCSIYWHLQLSTNNNPLSVYSQLKGGKGHRILLEFQKWTELQPHCLEANLNFSSMFSFFSSFQPVLLTAPKELMIELHRGTNPVGLHRYSANMNMETSTSY